MPAWELRGVWRAARRARWARWARGPRGWQDALREGAVSAVEGEDEGSSHIPAIVLARDEEVALVLFGAAALEGLVRVERLPAALADGGQR